MTTVTSPAGSQSRRANHRDLIIGVNLKSVVVIVPKSTSLASVVPVRVIVNVVPRPARTTRYRTDDSQSRYRHIGELTATRNTDVPLGVTTDVHGAAEPPGSLP